MEELKPELGVSQGFSSVQWSRPPYWRWSHISSCWSRSPEGQVWAGSVPSNCVLYSLAALVPLSQREQGWSKRGLRGHLVWAGVHAGVVLAWQSFRPFLICCLCKSQYGCPYPLQMPCWVWTTCVPHNCALSLALAAFTLVGSCAVEQDGPEWALSSGWGPSWSSHGKLTRVPSSFNLVPPPCFGSKQICVQSSQAESRFLTAPGFKRAKGTHPPNVKPQGWGTQYAVQTTHSPQRISQPMWSSSSSVSSPRGVGLDLIASLPFLPNSMWMFVKALVV